MTSILPSPDDTGVYDHPYLGTRLTTYMGKCPCGCDEPAVLYEDGSVCLPQSVVLRDQSAGFMLNLSHCPSLVEFLDYIREMRFDPAEYLIIRDDLDLQHWSLMIGRALPEVVALCLMAKLDRFRFEGLQFLSRALATKSSNQLQAETVNDLVCRYLEELRPRLVPLAVRQRLEVMSNWSPLDLLYRRQQKGLKLEAFFDLQNQLDPDALSLVFSGIPKTLLLLIHQARYDRAGFEEMMAKLGPIPDPQAMRESGPVGRFMTQLGVATGQYFLRQQDLLLNLTLEPEYTDADWDELCR